MTDIPIPTRQRLVDLLAGQAVKEGFSPAPLAGVRYVRASHDYPRAPALYEPCIMILAAGRKRAHLGGAVHVLDPGHYWVVSVPLPFDCETEASPDAPLLGLSMAVEPAFLGELLLDMDDDGRPGGPLPAGMCATPLPDELVEAAVRLLACLATPLDARILGPGIVREIVYRVLRGDQGAALRAFAARNGHLKPIARTLRRIHEACDTGLDVEALAREAHMGISTFHHAFRAVTATSPLQYIKTVRLHRARRLLAEAGATAGEAAVRVGYASASQFSREYKRFFGIPPSEDAQRLRAAQE
jgi:AraC-like DNA-binding protein